MSLMKRIVGFCLAAIVNVCVIVKGAVRDIVVDDPPATTVVTTTVRYNDHSLKCRITAYTPYDDGGKWGYSTATGVKSQHLKTCAVDPKVIPLGTTIYVNGLTLKAVDVGGGIKGNIIDVFYDGTDAQAQAWLNSFGEYHTVTW